MLGLATRRPRRRQTKADVPRLRAAGLELLDTGDRVVSTEVDVPVDAVSLWSTIVDNSTWSGWFDGCRSCEGQPTVWTAVGDTRRIDVRPLVVDETCIVFEPEKRWGFRLDRTNLPLASAAIEVLDLIDTSRDGEVRTTLRWTGALELGWQHRLGAGFTTQRMIDAWGRSLERLAERHS